MERFCKNCIYNDDRFQRACSCLLNYPTPDSYYGCIIVRTSFNQNNDCPNYKSKNLWENMNKSIINYLNNLWKAILNKKEK